MCGCELRRKVASAKQWQKIIAAKQGPCRCCGSAAMNGRLYGRIQFHPVVPRGAPHFGDDVADNIVPLCPDCHHEITCGNLLVGTRLAATLEPAEIAYAVARISAATFKRLYGSVPSARDAWDAP